MSGHEATAGGITRRRLIGGAAAGAGVALLVEPARRLSRAPFAFGAPAGEWLAGDLHIHTWYSHDVLRAGYPVLEDDNTGPEDFYTTGYDVAQRFQQASDRGLDFIAITDHDDVRSFADPGFASAGVVGIPAYEASIKGHAQVLGARRYYDKGDGSLAAAERLADSVRADGGLFQANHPAYRLDQPYQGCACGSCNALHWQYGLDLRPDTVEVWNAASPPNAVAEEYWECWLELGERIAATGGCDGHWQSVNEFAGPGQPTTWVYARERSARGVLEGIRDGRTAIASQPPARGGSRPVLEGDAALAGDEVRPGAPLRVRMEPGLSSRALVRVRANGRVLLDRELPPSGEVRFDAPRESGWVRALVLVDETVDPRAAACRGGREAETFNCRENGLIVAGLTSPIYVVGPGVAPPRVAPRAVPGPPATSDGNRWPDESVPAGDVAAAPPAGALGLRVACGRSVSRHSLLVNGLRVGVSAGRPGTVKARLALASGARGTRTLALGRARLDRAGRIELRLRPLVRRRGRLRGSGAVAMVLTVTFTGRDGRRADVRRGVFAAA